MVPGHFGGWGIRHHWRSRIWCRRAIGASLSIRRPETNLADSHSQSIRTLSLTDLRDQRRGRAKPQPPRSPTDGPEGVPSDERASPPSQICNVILKRVVVHHPKALLLYVRSSSPGTKNQATQRHVFQSCAICATAPGDHCRATQLC